MRETPFTALPAPEILGLQALAHVVADPEMGPRFLALTGLDPAALRARAGEAALLAEVIGFLAAREADLVAAADALGVSAAALAAAGERLGN
jgi:hypothetical protein